MSHAPHMHQLKPVSPKREVGRVQCHCTGRSLSASWCNRIAPYPTFRFDIQSNCTYNLITMEISFDANKNQHNIRTRGIPFQLVVEFDFSTAIIWQDIRKNYSEHRYVAIGYLSNRLHVLVFSETPAGIRVISLRKANHREGNKHGYTLTKN